MFEATEGVCLNSRLISGIQHQRMIDVGPRDQETLSRALQGPVGFFAALLLLSISMFTPVPPAPAPQSIALGGA